MFLKKLAYYETFELIVDDVWRCYIPVEREKFIKGKSRKWKEGLINAMNPEWRDLTEEVMQRYR